MIIKGIAVAILCIIIVGQWIVGVRGNREEGLGCMMNVLMTVWTLFLIALLYFAGVLISQEDNNQTK